MKQGRLWVLSGVAALAATVASPAGQPRPPMPFDHVHLTVPDPAKAYAWYVDRLQGREAEFPGRAAFEPWRLTRPLPVQLLFSAGNAGPSEGSVIESLGFSYPDQQGTIRDPFGVTIELVDDPDLRGFHHVRLRVPNVDQALAWYEEFFGGTRVRIGGDPALRYDNMIVIVSAGASAPSRGRAIDHVSWGPTDIRTTVATLRTRGQQIVGDITGPNKFGHHIAYLEDPQGTYIELVQHNELLGRMP